MSIYYCTNKNNTCLKKDDCKRYLNADGKNHATLYKYACTENNNYLLFMKKEEENNSEEQQ